MVVYNFIWRSHRLSTGVRCVLLATYTEDNQSAMSTLFLSFFILSPPPFILVEHWEQDSKCPLPIAQAYGCCSACRGHDKRTDGRMDGRRPDHQLRWLAATHIFVGPFSPFPLPSPCFFLRQKKRKEKKRTVDLWQQQEQQQNYGSFLFFKKIDEKEENEEEEEEKLYFIS